MLELANRMAEDYGCVGVIVDARPGAVDFYAKDGLIPIEAVEGQSDARPRPTPMFLAMRAIRAAQGAPSGRK